MALAILATWAQPGIIVHHVWIVIAIVLGVAVGVPLSRVPLTAVPQRTALSHAFGGLAAGLVGTAKYYLWLSRRAREPHRVPHGRDHRRDHARLPDLHRQPDGRRQAAGDQVDPAAAGHLPGPEHRQPRPARWSALGLGVVAGAQSDRRLGRRWCSRSSSCCRWSSACC